MPQIMWCAPDGSWGQCDADDLFIVSEEDITVEISNELDSAASDKEVRSILAHAKPTVALFLTPDESRMLRDAADAGSHQWEQDADRETKAWREARQNNRSPLVVRRLRMNAMEFRAYARDARALSTRIVRTLHAARDRKFTISKD